MIHTGKKCCKYNHLPAHLWLSSQPRSERLHLNIMCICFIFHTKQVSLAIFATYILSDPTHILTTTKIFVSVVLIYILNFPMSLLSVSVAAISQVRQFGSILSVCRFKLQKMLIQYRRKYFYPNQKLLAYNLSSIHPTASLPHPKKKKKYSVRFCYILHSIIVLNIKPF